MYMQSSVGPLASIWQCCGTALQCGTAVAQTAQPLVSSCDASISVCSVLVHPVAGTPSKDATVADALVRLCAS